MSPPPTSVPPRVRRRSFLAASGGAAAALGLGSCAGSDAPTVTVHQSKPEAIPNFREFTADFNTQQDAFRYVHDTASNVPASFVRENPPDLGCINYNLETARFMERGALSDLSDMEIAGRIRDDVLDLADWYPTYEDRTSVIPYSVMAASVIYNRTIFEEHGLEVPTTWDEFIDVCKTLQSEDVTPIYATYRDPWTITQGLFDYTIGGLLDTRSFYDSMHEIGEDVGPDSEVSFQKDFREPVERMRELLEYVNPDAASRGYGDGNTAMAQEQAAMYFQGPWALSEIDKADVDVDLGTFPLPMTGDPADLKVRVNIDISLWVPESANEPEGARQFIDYLMRPEVVDPYNQEFLGFGTTTDAPPTDDERLLEMQEYYDEGRFYMGASQFIPLTIPYENYIQSLALGEDPDALLAQMDADWARLAYRE